MPPVIFNDRWYEWACRGARRPGRRRRDPVVTLSEPLSFRGGVDPADGRVIDVHHPQDGTSLSGAIVVMPASRGSCSGSGIVLDLAWSGRGPAALVFSAPEAVATLGAIVAAEMFDRTIPILRLPEPAFAALTKGRTARIIRNPAD